MYVREPVGLLASRTAALRKLYSFVSKYFEKKNDQKMKLFSYTSARFASGRKGFFRGGGLVEGAGKGVVSRVRNVGWPRDWLYIQPRGCATLRAGSADSIFLSRNSIKKIDHKITYFFSTTQNFTF